MTINVRDFGATGLVAQNASPHIQSAITAAVALGETVFFPAGTYRIETTIQQPYQVTLSGEGMSSVIKVDNAIDGITAGKKYAIEATGNFWKPTKAHFFTVLENIQIDATDNVSDFTFFNTTFDYNCCVMNGVSFIGNRHLDTHDNTDPDDDTVVRQTAFHAYHSRSGTNASDLHNNVFRNCSFRYLYGPECIWFEGDASADRQANNNLFDKCWFSQYRTAARIEGIKNVFDSCLFNEPERPVFFEGESGDKPNGSDFRLVFSGGRDNVIKHCWFEVGDNQVMVMGGTSGDSETVHSPLYAYSPNNSLNATDHVADVVAPFGYLSKHIEMSSTHEVRVVGVNLVPTPTDNKEYKTHTVFNVNNGEDGVKESILRKRELIGGVLVDVDPVEYTPPDGSVDPIDFPDEFAGYSTLHFLASTSVTEHNVSIVPIYRPVFIDNDGDGNKFRLGGDHTDKFSVGEDIWVEFLDANDMPITRKSTIGISDYNGTTTKVTIGKNVIHSIIVNDEEIGTVTNVWPTAPSNRAIFVP